MAKKLKDCKTGKEAFENVPWVRRLVIGTIVFIGFVFLVAIAEGINKSGKQPENKPAEQTTTTQEEVKFVQGGAYKTNSGIDFKIKKLTDVAGQPYYNVIANISKADTAWHDKAKEVIKYISEKINTKDFSVSISDKESNTDLLNWNIQKDKKMFYTYPVEDNESEVFEL
jgi:hypothetical protein